jgi:hypothetical protein
MLYNIVASRPLVVLLDPIEKLRQQVDEFDEPRI